MADTIKSSNELKLVANFYDGDTRTITLDNPKGGLSATDIHSLETVMISTQPIVGDKGGAQFTGFGSAKIFEKTKINVDLS